MAKRQNKTVTRIDIPIPNQLYARIQEIAINQFHAKIHHHSSKPEISPTINLRGLYFFYRKDWIMGIILE